VAGARPGLQNQCARNASDKSGKGLHQSPSHVTAQGQRAASEDPDLAAVVAAWPKLPEAIKAGIRAMVRTSLKGDAQRRS
jgi:hypothetical protein